MEDNDGRIIAFGVLAFFIFAAILVVANHISENESKRIEFEKWKIINSATAPAHDRQ